ncbi:MAG: hypothetical protein GKR87_03850 [Kiritimatiellae bacterium]|nr:hypothetical protein [Kiritimatiellia bacterium]
MSVYKGLGSGGGGHGSDGRIRLEAFAHNFTGSSFPGPYASAPGLIFLSSNTPSVRVVSIDGQPIPSDPTGNFIPADVDITNASPVILNIQAENIPAGSIVDLTMWSEAGNSTNFSSSPLVGTEQPSTATGVVTVPYGFSRFYIDASWTN